MLGNHQMLQIVLISIADDDAVKIEQTLSGSGLDFVLWPLRVDDNPAAFIRNLARKSETVLLCNYHLPETDGLDFCLQQRSWWPALTTILMARHGSEQLAAQAIKQGIDQYVSVDLHDQYLGELPELIRSSWEEHQLLELRRESERQQQLELIAEINALKLRNAELDSFAHTVAHDLKNPLSALSGLASVLCTQYDAMSSSERDRIGETIVNCGNKAIAIVEELLKLGRSDEGIEYGYLDVAELIEAARFRLMSLEAEVEPIIHLPISWPTAIGYGPWVEEVWSNYISNGLKYGGRPCILTIGGDYLDSGMTRFWVRDNGPGLWPHQLQQIFEPYNRAHDGTQEGNGLGLSIVKRIVERHGGQVGVKSQPGEGSEFWFTLPSGNFEALGQSTLIALAQSQPEPSHLALTS